METEATNRRLSAVIPVFNEQAVLAEFYRRLSQAVETISENWEFIFVDDGSTDGSLALLKDLAAADERVAVLSFTRNFGHQAAITAGIDCAQGKAIIILDADLQDPPELIQEMMGRWRQGYEVVYAVRCSRKESALKRIAYHAFYRLLSRIAEIPIHADSGDFCLLDARVARIIRQMPERNRFIRGMRSWVGFRQISVEYDRPERAAGQTHYTWKKLVKLARDGIFSFSYAPLRLALYTGCLSIIASLTLMGWILFKRLTSESYVAGVTTTVLLVLFFGGWQLFVLGVVGEYIGRIYDEVKKRPLYLIREQIGASEKIESMVNAAR